MSSPYRGLNIQVESNDEEFNQTATQRISNLRHREQSVEDPRSTQSKNTKNLSTLFEFFKTPRDDEAETEIQVVLNNNPRRNIVSQNE